jgi:TetR/AcrR family transcriptional repressor of nem operon
MARKCEFDREVVLSKAMNLFWEVGYCQTSMAKLVEVTDLKPGSLYAAFSSKEGLFSSALDLYGQRSLSALKQCLAESDSPLQGVIDFVHQLADEVVNDRNQKGCLLVNTALEVSPHSKRIRKQVNTQLGAIEAAIFGALQSAAENGALSGLIRPKQLAKHIMVNIWGIRVLGQTTDDKQAIRESLNILLSLLREQAKDGGS